MNEHICDCKFCPIYHEAVKETSSFHDWIAKNKPHIWAELVNDYMAYKLLGGK